MLEAPRTYQFVCRCGHSVDRALAHGSVEVGPYQRRAAEMCDCPACEANRHPQRGRAPQQPMRLAVAIGKRLGVSPDAAAGAARDALADLRQPPDSPRSGDLRGLTLGNGLSPRCVVLTAPEQERAVEVGTCRHGVQLINHPTLDNDGMPIDCFSTLDMLLHVGI